MKLHLPTSIPTVASLFGTVRLLFCQGQIVALHNLGAFNVRRYLDRHNRKRFSHFFIISLPPYGYV